MLIDRKRTLTSRAACFALAVTAVTACSKTQPNADPASTPVAVGHVQVTTRSEDALDGAVVPRRGRWRLAPREELAHVVLWVSHILIRHAEADAASAPLAEPGWNVQPPPPKRTRAQAFELARSLAQRASAAPHRFAELARAHSEDRLTSELGGSLGGVTAGHLIGHPAVLDALAELRPGEVSPVVETSFGFHILLRRPAPPEQEISARRIVIGHVDAPWLGDFQRRQGKVQERTRDEARTLAASLVDELRARPEAFASHVAAHSEHADAVAGGDIGSWSNLEPTPLRRQIERLATMKVGEISDPVETAMGFEILERTPVRERARYTISAIKLPFAPGAEPSRPESLQNARQRAESILRFIAHQPQASLADFQREYCCTEHESWSEGRGDRALSAALDAAPVGSVLPRIFTIENQLVIAQKLAPEAPLPPRFELPAPELPNLEHVVQGLAGEGVQAYIEALTGQLVATLGLEGDTRDRFERLHLHFAKGLQYVPPNSRPDALNKALEETRELLGQRDFERYMALLNSDVAKVLMQ